VKRYRNKEIPRAIRRTINHPRWAHPAKLTSMSVSLSGKQWNGFDTSAQNISVDEVTAVQKKGTK
jgi:hypothetical protein